MYYYEQGQYYQLTIFVNINCQKHQIWYLIPRSAVKILAAVEHRIRWLRHSIVITHINVHYY